MDSIIRERATEGETVRSVVIFSRHGDRTAKIVGPTKLTTLGKTQVYASGEFYRARYLNSNSTHFIKGISGGEYVAKDVFASAPDQVLPTFPVTPDETPPWTDKNPLNSHYLSSPTRSCYKPSTPHKRSPRLSQTEHQLAPLPTANSFPFCTQLVPTPPMQSG